MSWMYKRYSRCDGATDQADQYLTTMKKVGGEERGAPVVLTFTGSSPEHVREKIDQFWDRRAKKTANRAAGRMKTEATKAMRESE